VGRKKKACEPIFRYKPGEEKNQGRGKQTRREEKKSLARKQDNGRERKLLSVTQFFFPALFHNSGKGGLRLNWTNKPGV
jgi:hypothetical protein